MTQTFSLFSREGASPYFPGAPFLLSMLLMGVCLLIALRNRPQALADAQ